MKKNPIPKSFRTKSASIMTLIGVGGVIVTAILSGRSTVKALEIVDDRNYDYDTNNAAMKKEVVKAYLPTVISGATTIFCILCSNYISKKHQANLVGALASSSTLLERYRTALKNSPEGKIVETEIAESAYDDIKPKLEPEKLLYFDQYSQRFFYSTEADVCSAMYKFNRNFLLAYGMRSISEFYDFLGLDETENLVYESFGYNAYTMEVSGLRPWIDWTFRKATLADGTDYISMDFLWDPQFEYWKDAED